MKGELSTQIKENQGNLYQETQEGCRNLQPLSTFIAPVEKRRNRIEYRETAVFDVKSYLIESHDWHRYIACIIQVNRHTQILDTKNKTWKMRKEISPKADKYIVTNGRIRFLL